MMRRKELEVLDKGELIGMIESCSVCRIGLLDKYPYIVPMNFGYSWEDHLTLYFHCAPKGRKIDLLKANPKVCFEMDFAHALVAGDTACRYSYQYASVMGEGEARFLQEYDEKLEALKAIMRRVTGTDDHAYEEQAVRNVTVFAVDAKNVTGKRR